MRILDRIHITVREARHLGKYFVMALSVEIALFSICAVLLNVWTDFDTSMDRYFLKNSRSIMSVSVYHLPENYQRYEKEYSFHIEDTYEEEGELCGSGYLTTIHNYYSNQEELSNEGVIIQAEELETVLDGVLFIKAIFFGMAVLGLGLCLIAVVNLSNMILDVRKGYALMLHGLGEEDGKICGIYEMTMLVTSCVAGGFSTLLARFFLVYINRLLTGDFSAMRMKQGNIWSWILLIWAITNAITFFSIRKGYRKYILIKRS